VAEEAGSCREKPSALLLIGGGRWARVYLSILVSTDGNHDKVVIVSRHGDDRLIDAVAQANHRQPSKFAIATDLETALEAHTVTAAIVANAARDHVPMTLSLLRRNIAVLVEKPAALSLTDAVRLGHTAQSARSLLMPAHVLRHCAYLQNFSAQVERPPAAITSIVLDWRDMADEARYGETKSYDPSLGVAEDVGPHIATILSLVAGSGPGLIDAVEIRRGGLAVATKGLWNGIPFALTLERDGPSRTRRIVVKKNNGSDAQLDFTDEPGTVSVGGAARNADPDWARRPGPLTLQLQEFFARTAKGVDVRLMEEMCMVTDFTAMLAGAVRVVQKDWLGSSSWKNADPHERLVALRELIAPLLIEAGLWHSGDRDRLGEFARQALAIADGAPGTGPADIVRILAAQTRG
jgi:hypothetical protein